MPLLYRIRGIPLIDGFCTRGKCRHGRKEKAALTSLPVFPSWRRPEDMSAMTVATELQSLSANLVHVARASAWRRAKFGGADHIEMLTVLPMA